MHPFMNLKLLSNPELISHAAQSFEKERALIVSNIACLEEIELRRAYLDLHYSSLHDFAVRHLKLSDGSAARRINSMRLSKELP